MPHSFLLSNTPRTSATSETLAQASTVVLPAGNWPTLFEALCTRFPAISRETWRQRILNGKVLDAAQEPIGLTCPHHAGTRLYYFREVANETPIPFVEQILYQDQQLLVVDKPPFLPVIPSGRFVTQTLQYRLMQRLGNQDIQPLHRLDRHTSGLVLFALTKATRDRYQALFRDRAIEKVYEAIAPALPTLNFPHLRQSRIERDQRFFRSCEVEGEINAQTKIEVIEQLGSRCHYRLTPITGKKHQLRVHMAALGAPLENDALYPLVDDVLAEDFQRPLQLLASELRFTDPISGLKHHFTSQEKLCK